MLNHPNIAPWPNYEPDEVEASLQTLTSGRVNYWTGELGKCFEQAYAKYLGKSYGIALSNGTVALELALRALEIGPGDEVIVASRSYVASASCVLIVGATPIFADVDNESGNISPETISPLITAKTKAIIPVHVGGWPCDMPGIMALANKYQLKVIEDCAQAHGAFIQGKPVGAWGHASIFSFCQDKIISTGGEGGMLILDDEIAYKKAWSYKDIGRSYDLIYKKNPEPGFRWLTESAGSNFRMTEFQAAIGLKQLSKLAGWIEQRNTNAKAIIQVLSRYEFISVYTLSNKSGNLNAFYRLYAKINPQFGLSAQSALSLRDTLIKHMTESGVPCFSGSCAEVYREQAFDAQGLSPKNRLPNAVDFSENAFCFLVHHTITEQQLNFVCKRIEEVLTSMQSHIKRLV
jgi:dTDP-4-amino-4,6-dideoxygalactose transaminase